MGCPYMPRCGRLPASADIEQFRANAAPWSRQGWFQSLTRLEAASVVAFDELAADLQAHGAPDALVSAALRARDDEIRHTRVAARLAGDPAPEVPEFQRTVGRSIEQLAIHNVTAGCVNQTF